MNTVAALLHLTLLIDVVEETKRAAERETDIWGAPTDEKSRLEAETQVTRI